MDEDQLRNEIAERVTQLYKIRKQNEKPFVPGVSQINYAGRIYDEDELKLLVSASLDFWLTTGQYATKFESGLAEYIGIKHCSLTNSGSSANLLAMSALTSPKLNDRTINPGDEVITTACGFPTTLNPIVQNRLMPVFLDVSLGSYNIRSDQINDAITDKTKAIFVPHTLGNPADMKTICEVAEDHNLWVIEDNCDALGSKYNGQKTGTFGDISTCSFYPAHTITTGEGGAVLTNNNQLNKIINSFRDWGRDCWCHPGKDNSCGHRHDKRFGLLPKGYDHKYVYTHIGYNLKATDMQAAIGVAQLKKLPEFVEARKRNFNKLYSGLRRYQKFLILPESDPLSEPSWFGFPLMVIPAAPFRRHDLVEHLEKNHIATRMLFGGNLIKQPAYVDIKHRVFDNLHNTDLVMKDVFWIGVYPGLTDDMIEYTLNMFKSFFDGVT